MDRFSCFPDLAAALPAPWGGDDEWLQCVQVRQETHDVRTFVFCPEAPRSFRYRPGQHLTFALTLDGEPVRRCYTLASSPTRPDTVSITVKRTPGGRVSAWLHENLRAGMRVSVSGPAGEFSCFDGKGGAPKAPLLFLSGGSGITPLMSMARALHDLAHDADVVFVHAARTPEDVIFAEELALMTRNLPRFRLAIICESRGGTPEYSGMLGRLSLPMLQSIAPDFLQREVYCCGPGPFMEAVRKMLLLAGCDMERYHEESFTFDTDGPAQLHLSSAAAAGCGNAAPNSYEVRLSKRGEAFRCNADQTVLQAAVAAGIRVPFSCQNGVCGTCRTMKVSGEVAMQPSSGLRPREVQQGWLLLCCSKPQSDLVLDR